jgi:type VII secretion protein EccB
MARMNQRDQAHAYHFLARRLSSALVRDDPDSPDAPMRRLGIASFASIMIAALAVAGIGVYGIVRPGGATAWKNGQSLILEEGTGTRYIYARGELHPVLNYSSARLLLGQQAFSTVSVSPASLRGVRQGPPIGIPGAPEELPVPSTLAAGPWSVCSLPAQDAAGDPTAYVRVSAGVPVTGSVLPGAKAVLVTSPDGTVYLVWNGTRLRIPGGQAELAALGYTSVTPLAAGDAFLTVLPQGPDLAAPPVPGLGGSGPLVNGRRSRIGQIFIASGGDYYVALRGGLAPVSFTDAELLLADPAARPLYPPGRPGAIPVPSAAVAVVTQLPSLTEDGLPARPPAPLALPGGQAAICAVYQHGTDLTPQVRTFTVPASQIPVRSGAAPVAGLGQPQADQVRLPDGDGAVVQAATPGQGNGTVYLITSEGIKYPLTSVSLLPSLGLPGVNPVAVPEVVLGLLPTGPTLDPHAASLTTG